MVHHLNNTLPAVVLLWATSTDGLDRRGLIKGGYSQNLSVIDLLGKMANELAIQGTVYVTNTKSALIQNGRLSTDQGLGEL